MKTTRLEAMQKIKIWIDAGWRGKLWLMWNLLRWQTPFGFYPDNIEVSDNWDKTKKYIEITLK